LSAPQSKALELEIKPLRVAKVPEGQRNQVTLRTYADSCSGGGLLNVTDVAFANTVGTHDQHLTGGDGANGKLRANRKQLVLQVGLAGALANPSANQL